MSVGKASIRPCVNQALTANYVVADNYTKDTSISEESLASIEILYTTGAGEVNSNLNFVIYYSWDATNWVPECSSNIANGVDTIKILPHKIKGGAGGTLYTGYYLFPLCSRNIRILIKEEGVVTNFGSVTITITEAAGSGQARNLQLNDGTQEVNLTEVGGSAITLGQKTMANSLPITIASDQSEIDVDVNSFGGSAVSLGAKTTAQSIPVTLPTDIEALATVIKDLGITLRYYLAQLSTPTYIDENYQMRMPVVAVSQSGTWSITDLATIGTYSAEGVTNNLDNMSNSLNIRNLIS